MRNSCFLCLLLALMSTVLVSCKREPWDENTKPVRLEMKLVIGVSDEGELTLDEEVLIDNGDIAKAVVDFDIASKPVIGLQMTVDGSRKFAAVTQAHIDQQIAIVVDGQVFCAPRVMTRIPEGRAQISLPGSVTVSQADAIVAGILKYNSVTGEDEEPVSE